MLSVTGWCRNFMSLRAVVDTGGKSLHAWFDFPPDSALSELRIILPELGCDPAMFKAAQPCRIAGGWRQEKQRWQRFIWLNLKGANQ